MQMDPTDWAQVYRALLHQRGPPLLIEPKCTETYYTKPVEPIKKWGGPPQLIDPKCTEPYYTKPVEPLEK